MTHPLSKYRSIIYTNFLVFLFLLSCHYRNVTTAQLSNINTVKIEAIPMAHRISIQVKGRVDCPAKLTLLSNGRKTNTVFELDGYTNQKQAFDWYEEEVSFQLSPEDCAGHDATVTVVIFD